MKWWPTIILALTFFFFIDFYSVRESKKYEMLDDGCLVQSLYFQQAIQAEQMLDDYMWSRVLCMHFYGSLEGHAVTVFIYKNITWVYDPNRGSFPIAQYPLFDPVMIAELVFPKLYIKRAYYIEPTLLLHYPQQPRKIVW